jgi:hypothetical protein
MKKLIIGVLFLVSLTSSSQAQIMLGYSVKDVKNTLDNEGYVINTGWTKDSIFYISGRDNLLFRVYYFNSYNECIVYMLFIDSTKEELIKFLLDQGYYKIGDTFYNDIYKVTLNYEEDSELYYYIWTVKS